MKILSLLCTLHFSLLMTVEQNHGLVIHQKDFDTTPITQYPQWQDVHAKALTNYAFDVCNMVSHHRNLFKISHMHGDRVSMKCPKPDILALALLRKNSNQQLSKKEQLVLARTLSWFMFPLSTRRQIVALIKSTNRNRHKITCLNESMQKLDLGKDSAQ